MAIVGYKRRPRLHFWEPPEPPPPRPSRALWYALVAWLSALYLGYVWLERAPQAPPSEAPERTYGPSAAPPAALAAPIAAEPTAKLAAEVEMPPSRSTATQSDVAPSTAPLPPCESFLSAARGNEQERLPTHLGRSVLDRFLGDTSWTRPCRGRKRRATVRFCAAVQDGTLVGLTLSSVPKSLGLEECIREQAQNVPIKSEPVVRIVDVNLEL